MKQDETGVSAAHRALGAALKGFSEDEALEALAMITAEWMFSYYKNHQRPELFHLFDGMVRRDVQIIRGSFAKLNMAAEPNRAGKMPRLLP